MRSALHDEKRLCNLSLCLSVSLRVLPSRPLCVRARSRSSAARVCFLYRRALGWGARGGVK